ncbi:unnamed protein product [Paramecium octaurelia]|uniref:Uncharacterized protein n=1 Tax=Paramecium octaurelia TaxID=43137 RepID=A0A8S1TPC8_PAROT|nr:unnamed protein product [Paramecium octaurelia]
MKRSIASVKDLADYFNVAIQHRANNTIVAGQYVARKVSIVSLFMQTTKGRDKICCLIQYLADLYEACIKFSNIPEIQAASSDMFSKKIASRIRESMKNGRKIFKFLKFFDSIRCLSNIHAKNKPKYYKITTSIMHVCNFFYYIMDHIIWGINIGVLNEIVSLKAKSTIKGYKDSFSLAKALLKLLKSFFDYKIIYDKEMELVKEIKEIPDKLIQEDAIAVQCANSLINSRQKRRIKQLNFIVTSLRIVMLLRRLKLFGLNKKISKIFYSCSGLTITLINIMVQLINNNDLINQKLEKNEKEKDKEKEKKLARVNSFIPQNHQLKKVKSELERVLGEDSENEGD